jgi:hypothetical protein
MKLVLYFFQTKPIESLKRKEMNGLLFSCHIEKNGKVRKVCFVEPSIFYALARPIFVSLPFFAILVGFFPSF